MNEVTNVKKELVAFNSWIESLYLMDEKLFFTPIKAGKWTPAEIISHITYWDRYIDAEMLPVMTEDAAIHSVDFEVINTPAAAYALSGVSQSDLLDAQLEARNNLVAALSEKTEEEFFQAFTLNGEVIDEYSGYPHTLYNYLMSFIWHDNHHKDQIEAFLANTNKV
ncbi:DinB family protein [Ornithinibacillus contaminans]|uniref:DinB family protein n=1 Tax=Ornithinibacillus contaminans TaxID=694055 RepID=UPI00064D8C8C|nr:DinB family protein [Ornithinibacillus contaminans]